MQQKRLLQPEMMVMMTIKMKTMTIKMVKLLVERVGRTVHSVNLRVHTSRRQRELTPQLVGSDDCGDYLDFDDGSSLVRRLNFGGVPTYALFCAFVSIFMGFSQFSCFWTKT